MKVKLFECRKSKRIFVPILDFILFLLIGLSIFIPLDLNMYDIGYDTFKVKQEVCLLQKDSHLFKVTEDDNRVITKVDQLYYSIEEKDFYKNYIKDIYSYYSDFKDKQEEKFTYTNRYFNEKVLKFDELGTHPLFKTINLDDSPLNIEAKEEIKDLYSLNENKDITSSSEAYNKTLEKYLKTDSSSVYFVTLYDFAQNENFIIKRDKIEMINLFQMSFAFGLAALIYYLILPLFFKNGETLMMSLFKIGLIGQNGYGIKKFHTVIRGTLYTILIVFSFYLYFIPLLLNIGTFFFTRCNRSLLDFASGTLIIDTHISQFYRRREDDPGIETFDDDE